MKMIHRGEKGFTLIELLVVIAILGVIAAVVALNVGSFFGRGTVQAANTELHQVQTAIISAMAECEGGTLQSSGWWSGGNGTIVACNETGGDAAFYVYGPFRAAYEVDSTGRILQGSLTQPGIGDPWSNISWNATNKNWQAA